MRIHKGTSRDGRRACGLVIHIAALAAAITIAAPLEIPMLYIGNMSLSIGRSLSALIIAAETWFLTYCFEKRDFLIVPRCLLNTCLLFYLNAVIPPAAGISEICLCVGMYFLAAELVLWFTVLDIVGKEKEDRAKSDDASDRKWGGITHEDN